MAHKKIFWKITAVRGIDLKGVKPYYLDEYEAIDACPYGAWVERHEPKKPYVNVGYRDKHGKFQMQ